MTNIKYLLSHLKSLAELLFGFNILKMLGALKHNIIILKSLFQY